MEKYRTELKLAMCSQRRAVTVSAVQAQQLVQFRHKSHHSGDGTIREEKLSACIQLKKCSLNCGRSQQKSRFDPYHNPLCRFWRRTKLDLLHNLTMQSFLISQHRGGFSLHFNPEGLFSLKRRADLQLEAETIKEPPSMPFALVGIDRPLPDPPRFDRF